MGFLANLAAGLLHALERLALTFESIGEFNHALDSLGWKVTIDHAGFARVLTSSAATDPFANLETIVEQIEAGTGDPIALAEQLVSGLKTVITQVRAITATPPATLPAPLD